MNLKEQSSIFLEGDKKEAILILHGFSGNANQMKYIGKELNKEGYSVSIPLYKGHGGDPEEIVKTDIKDWWESSVSGYIELRNKGYEKVSVVGISLGGIFALKLAQEFKVEKLVVISAPIGKRYTRGLSEKFKAYARIYKEIQGKEDSEIKKEIESINVEKYDKKEELWSFIEPVRRNLKDIKNEILIIHGKKDNIVSYNSANYIYKKVSNEEKKNVAFEKAPHAIIFSDEKENLKKEITNFFK